MKWLMAEEVGISYGSHETILAKDSGMRLVSAKFISQLLMKEQKHHFQHA
jgi:hypothetical protein